ncbi:MAG: hypothetical protein LBK59_01860, partial [Bifidobacteriaceae bacterium]|nr:hypothetical protein [Bifidobacteriaceae bacterium]
ALPVVSRIQVHSRERVLYDNTRADDGTWPGGPRAAEVLATEQARLLTPTEAVDWLTRYRRVFADACHRRGYLCQATALAYRLLQDDAAALIPVAATDPSIDAGRLRREHDARQTTLARAIPSLRTKPQTLNSRTTRASLANHPQEPNPSQALPHHDPPRLGP